MLIGTHLCQDRCKPPQCKMAAVYYCRGSVAHLLLEAWMLALCSMTQRIHPKKEGFLQLMRDICNMARKCTPKGSIAHYPQDGMPLVVSATLGLEFLASTMRGTSSRRRRSTQLSYNLLAHGHTQDMIKINMITYGRTTLRWEDFLINNWAKADVILINLT